MDSSGQARASLLPMDAVDGATVDRLLDLQLVCAGGIVGLGQIVVVEAEYLRCDLNAKAAVDADILVHIRFSGHDLPPFPVWANGILCHRGHREYIDIN